MAVYCRKFRIWNAACGTIHTVKPALLALNGIRIIGHLNSLNVGLVILPISRNSIWLRFFGIPFEKALKLHRNIARMVQSVNILNNIAIQVFVFISCHGSGWIYMWSRSHHYEYALQTPVLLGLSGEH
jgi:hypothetical protein